MINTITNPASSVQTALNERVSPQFHGSNSIVLDELDNVVHKLLPAKK